MMYFHVYLAFNEHQYNVQFVLHAIMGKTIEISIRNCYTVIFLVLQ